MKIKLIPYFGNINRILICFCLYHQISLICLFFKQSYREVFLNPQNRVYFFAGLIVFIPVIILTFFNIAYLEHTIIIYNDKIERHYLFKTLEVISWDEVKTFLETDKYIIISKKEVCFDESEIVNYYNKRGVFIIHKCSVLICKEHLRKIDFLKHYYSQRIATK